MSQPLFITDLLQQLKSEYVEVIDDATSFYSKFSELQGFFLREKEKLEEVNNQLKTILGYKQKNGNYPKIKDQADVEVYLSELNQIKKKADENIAQLWPKIQKGFEQRKTILDKLAGALVDAAVKERDAGKFLTTIVLRAPLSGDPSRCPNNEKNRPLYTSALTIQLVSQLAQKELLDNKFIQLNLPNWSQSNEQVTTSDDDDDEALEGYKANVLMPIVKACLLQSIGSYSPEAEALYKGNRYRQVDEKTRKSQAKAIYENTLTYLKWGLGKPNRNEFDDDSLFEKALQRHQIMEEILVNYSNPAHLLGNLIRVPMIYASFILSTKPKFDFPTMFKAYDVLSSAIDKKVVRKDVANILKKMVGRFPLGCGLYFISKETNLPERGVVTTLNPSAPNNAIVKQLTKRQVQFDDITQVEVTPAYNILYEAARSSSDFGPAYFKKQFPDGLYWNPGPLWERDIDHAKFWRRDNKVRKN